MAAEIDFLSLPEELKDYIFSFLRPKDLRIASQTCREFYRMTTDKVLWRKLCFDEYSPELQWNKVSSTDKSSRDWKGLYQFWTEVQTRWSSNTPQVETSWMGHSSSAFGCKFMGPNLLLTAGSDTSLRVWDTRCLHEGEEERETLWDCPTKEGLMATRSCVSGILGLGYDAESGLAVTGNFTGHAELWKIHNRTESELRQLKVKDLKTFLAQQGVSSGDCLEKEDLVRKALLYPIHIERRGEFAVPEDAERAFAPVASASVSQGLALISHGAGASLYNTDTLEMLHHFRAAPVDVVECHPQAHFACTGGKDATVRVWDMQQGGSVFNVHGHESWVWCLHMNPTNWTTLISGGVDSRVHVWDIRAKTRVASMQVTAECAGMAVDWARGRFLATDFGGKATLGDMRMWTKVFQKSLSQERLTRCSITPTQAAAVSFDGTIHMMSFGLE